MADTTYVYVLNATTQPITLRVNDTDAGTVPAGSEDAALGFKLGVLKVPRSASPSPGDAEFGSGSGANANTMYVHAPGQSITYTGITIDPAVYTLDENLTMFLFYSAAVLTHDGVVVWGQADEHGVPHPARIRESVASA